MDIEVRYNTSADRQAKIAENEAKGLRMLHDNYDSDWKPGDELHGVMVFTDQEAMPSSTKTVRNLATEIDDLKARVEKLERK